MEITEDDLFFADLSKQISLLIMDEDDGDVALSPPWHSYPLQDMSYVMASPPNIYGQGPRNVQEKNHQEGMKEMSKGTGVFIPKFALPRRKRTTTTFNHHHHPSRHNHSYNPNNNYSRPNYHHYKPQRLDYYTPRRFSQEESKANYYFINPDKI